MELEGGGYKNIGETLEETEQEAGQEKVSEICLFVTEELTARNASQIFPGLFGHCARVCAGCHYRLLETRGHNGSGGGGGGSWCLWLHCTTETNRSNR